MEALDPKKERGAERFPTSNVWRAADRQNVTKSAGPLGLWFAIMSSDKTVTDLRKCEGASQK